MADEGDRLEKMLADFEAAHAVEGKALRQMLNNTPHLRARVQQAVDHGQLSGFAPHPDKGAGSYNSETGKIQLPMDVLGSAGIDDPRNQAVNTTRLILGHEIGHAINKADIEKTNNAFESRIAEIARSPSPHDYTEALLARMRVQREREAKDEIAGINTLADSLKRNKPNATLKDLYTANDEMSSYIDKHGKTYAPKDGLSFGKDLKIDADNPRNVEAIGKLFYDARGYPQNYGAVGLGLIALAEDEAQLASPSRTRPEVRADLKALGIDPGQVPPEWMPMGFRDAGAPVVVPPAGRTPGADAHPGGADRALGDKVRTGVASAEQSLGKGWDDDSERMTASLTLLAKQKGFSERDDLTVAFNRPTPEYRGGELAFVYRGGATASPDPYANRAQMPTGEAIARPAQETYQQLQQYNQQAEAQRQVQESQVQAASAPMMTR